jgi:TonB-dependent receptor
MCAGGRASYDNRFQHIPPSLRASGVLRHDRAGFGRARPDGAGSGGARDGRRRRGHRLPPAYANAIATKRDTLEISDGISSDGLGRFPDLNVGEAIQRIPGVQINREADSRNATISLRGLPGTFARTTLNGGAFADPILNGSTPLGAFNSDIFTAINVIKSPSASNLAGGLSGNIDLRINPPWPARTAASPSCPTSTTTWATSAARWPRWATTST